MPRKYLNMSSIAVITARGGSKRIPRKNIKEFCGKPIIAYSIEAALESGLFSEVIVSTDDECIAELAKTLGASVPFMRSAETSDDYATTRDVLLEVLRVYDARDCLPEWFCCLYPTAPFVTAGKLQQGWALLQSGVSAVVPVVAFGFPPQRGMVIQGDHLRYAHPSNACARSQDLEPQYHDCGQFYFYRTSEFLKEDPMFGGEVAPLVVPEIEVQDIDNISDWNLAEAKYKIMESKTK